jgi:signal transduction histidine kinase
VRQTAEVATLTVHNIGNPIPEAELGILFQQYRRTRSAEEQLGWGIGLSVVKGITETLHGHVRVESSDQTGTAFIIDLPKDPELTLLDRQSPEHHPQPLRSA